MSATTPVRPTELAITLAALPGRHTDHEGWVSADEVRGHLKLLGFDASAQQVSAWLGRMARTECPWVERREHPWHSAYRQYRVTRFGLTDIANRFPGVRAQTPWLPVYRAVPA